MVQVHYAKRQYQKAIEVLRSWLKRSNELPVRARVAMAGCYYQLGKYEMAERCFLRVLEID